MVTVPPQMREVLHITEGQTLLCRVHDGRMVWDLIPDGRTFLTAWHARLTLPSAPAERTPMRRWLTVAGLLDAHRYPEGANAHLLQDCSRGLATLEADPTLLPDLVAAISQGTTSDAHADRSEIAQYLQTLLAWPGLHWAERDLWLQVLDYWTQTDETWSDATMTIREQLASPTVEAPVRRAEEASDGQNAHA